MVEWKRVYQDRGLEYWSESVMEDLVELREAEEKLAEKDKEIARLKNENTNMKKYINQRSDGGIPYPEVEPNFIPFKPTEGKCPRCGQPIKQCTCDQWAGVRE